MLRDQLERDQAATRKKLGELSAELALKTEDVERARQRMNVDEKRQSIAARHAQIEELAQHKLHQEQRLQQLQVGSDQICLNLIRIAKSAELHGITYDLADDHILIRACSDAYPQDDPEGVEELSPMRSERRGLMEAEGTLDAKLAIEEAAAATAKEEEAALAKELEVSGPPGVCYC
jgi:hypothetical protein